MESGQFDRITKLFSHQRLTRRSTVIGAGAGIAAIGLRHQLTSAQDATPVATPAPRIVDAKGAKNDTDPSFMFVQSFESGTSAPVSGSVDTYTLNLQHGGGQTVYFSDRPERIFGASPTGKFVDSLPFTAENPPNAALVMQAGTDNADVLVLELTDPTYDESVSTLTYTARVLSDYSDFDTKLQATPSASAVPATFDGASLFIDDCPDTSIWCFASSGILTCSPIGLVNNVGTCWSWLDASCNLCSGSPDDVCTSGYPSECGDGKCLGMTMADESHACGG